MPDNTLPMMTGFGQFGPLEMGGMLTVVKVREGLGQNDYRDPGAYRNPEGTMAHEIQLASNQPVHRSDGHTAGAPPQNGQMTARQRLRPTPITERRDTMKRFAFLTLALGLSVGFQSAFAQSPLIDGQITKVDQSAGKITIKHGPATKLGMDEGMTMIYKVQDPAMLTAVKAGDKIKFDADQVNGQYTVTKIEKAK